MPPKRRGKRGSADEQPKAEPKAKRQKRDSQKSAPSASNTNSEAPGPRAMPQAQQRQRQRQAESQFDEDDDDTHHAYGSEQQQATDDHAQERATEEEEKAGMENFGLMPFDMNLIQAEEWDVLSPDNRLYALNWSLIRAIGVLEYIHISLMELQDSEKDEDGDIDGVARVDGVQAL